MADEHSANLLVMLTEMRGTLQLQDQKMDSLITLVKAEQGHMKEEIAQVRGQQTHDRNNSKMAFEAVDKRLGDLEEWKMKAIGVGMVFSAMISAAAWFISTFFGKS